MSTRIYDRLGQTIRRSQDLRGLLEHVRRNRDDLVIKITESDNKYQVTVYWPASGEHGCTTFVDWRVLLDWLASRRSWSIDKIKIDAPLYDRIEVEAAPLFALLRKNGTYVFRHAYQA